MSDIAHRMSAANGINIHIAEQGQGPVVLLLHGFPELWYSWRHQLPALADWGAPIAWHCALLYPDRFSAVVALSVPYTPRSRTPPIQALKQVFADTFFYILYFQEPGAAELELEVDVRRSLRMALF